jgi:predicted transcriptional regulator of viral defense system
LGAFLEVVNVYLYRLGLVSHASKDFSMQLLVSQLFHERFEHCQSVFGTVRLRCALSNATLCKRIASMRDSSVARLIDAAERAGQLNLRTDELAKQLPGTSAEALRQALDRQRRRGRIARTSRGSGHWVIVPAHDYTAGAPPLEAWLHSFMTKTLQEPYYVGLLSAAEAHGASPYAVMVTQVVVPKPRRPLQVGRHRLHFIVRKNLEAVPTQWHETAAGRFKVNTPEATALELAARPEVAGGPARVAEVLGALAPAMADDALRPALDALHEVPAAQRLGTLLTLSGNLQLAKHVSIWLSDKPTRPVSLSPGHSQDNALVDSFKVRVPTDFQRANS